MGRGASGSPGGRGYKVICLDPAAVLRVLLPQVPGIAEFPCVFGKGRRLTGGLCQGSIQANALLAELLEAVGFPKRNVMVSQKAFHGLLGRLLGVEHDIAPQGLGRSGDFVGRRFEIQVRF